MTSVTGVHVVHGVKRRRISRRGKAGAPLWSLLLAVGLVLALPPVVHAGARAAAVRTLALYSFAAGQTPVRIPINPDGGAGAATVRFRGVQADDFAFDAHGTMYVAANLRNAILRVAPSGRVTTLATKVTAGLDNPTAVAFGTGPRDRTVLYITNAAYFSPHPRPSVEALPVGSPGAAVS